MGGPSKEKVSFMEIFYRIVGGKGEVKKVCVFFMENFITAFRKYTSF